ncbi:hypothetical protein D3C78_1197470 [compost metagenome]
MRTTAAPDLSAASSEVGGSGSTGSGAAAMPWRIASRARCCARLSPLTGSGLDSSTASGASGSGTAISGALGAAAAAGSVTGGSVTGGSTTGTSTTGAGVALALGLRGAGARWGFSGTGAGVGMGPGWYSSRSAIVQSSSWQSASSSVRLRRSGTSWRTRER